MQSMSKSKKAGLQFPVGRIKRHIKGGIQQRVADKAAVYLAAVLEYMAAEVLEPAGNTAKDRIKRRISARHVNLAIMGDEELNAFMGKRPVIADGGVPPHIHKSLEEKRSGKDES